MPLSKRISIYIIIPVLLTIPSVLYFLLAQNPEYVRPTTGDTHARQNASAANTLHSLLGPVSTRSRDPNATQFDVEAGIRGFSKGTYTRVLVVPHTSKDSITWIDDRLLDVSLALYVVDDLTAPLHPPKNKGHEVMVYLTYIIDHYEQLPEIIIFMHAHRHAWHNSDLLGFDAIEMIQRLNSERVIRHGYMNLRCAWDPGCPEWLHPYETGELLSKQEQGLLARSWSELFPLDPLPTVLGQACCAQFAVSRERVLSISRQRFVFYRDWLLRTPLTDYFSGRIWEFVWQYVFTGYETYCPAEHACYCDGFGVCFGGKVQYGEFLALRQSKNNYTKELEQLRKQQQTALEAGESVESDGNVIPGVSRLGEEAVLKGRIEMLEKELSSRRLDALERGKDVRNREAEVADSQ
ncbi:hypothetical protein MMC27_007958 [Xylographa pallens]|nr:hypothetical protein [Xylographa pallens]